MTPTIGVRTADILGQARKLTETIPGLRVRDVTVGFTDDDRLAYSVTVPIGMPAQEAIETLVAIMAAAARQADADLARATGV